MKSNLIYALLAAGLLASCSQDDVIQEQDQKDAAIGFSTFVDKASRAESTTTDNLETFKVWATKFRDGNANAVRIMDGVDVTKDGDAWVYSPKKYWVNENAYSFTALGSSKPNITKYYNYTPPALSDISYDTYLTHDMGILFFNNGIDAVDHKATSSSPTVNVAGAAGSADLVWATAKVPTLSEEGVGPSSVNLTFGHLLSRVNLKFVNKRTIEHPEVKINNVKVQSAATGVLDFLNFMATESPTEFTWGNFNGSFDCPFNFPSATPSGTNEYTLNTGENVTTLNQFILPSQGTIHVSFDCYTSVTTEDGPTGHINISKDIKFGAEGSPAPFKNLTLKPGYSYTLVAYLSDNLDNSGSINFTVEVSEYIDYSAPAYTCSFKDVNKVQTSNRDDDDAYLRTIAVDELNTVDELIYYGTRASGPVTDFADFTFTWSIPSVKGLTFDAENKLSNNPVYEKTVTVTKVSDLQVDLYIKGNYSPNGVSYTNEGYIPVTLTMKRTDGSVVLSETKNIPVKYTQTMTGGSQDGDDNDG